MNNLLLPDVVATHSEGPHPVAPVVTQALVNRVARIVGVELLHSVTGAGCEIPKVRHKSYPADEKCRQHCDNGC
jgi:hypothetical protein